MSDTYPAGPAARAHFEEFAGRHPDRVTVDVDMEDFGHARVPPSRRPESIRAPE